jgi:hypothetical protein
MRETQLTDPVTVATIVVHDGAFLLVEKRRVTASVSISRRVI